MSSTTSALRSARNPSPARRRRTAKQQLQELLRELPDDCTIEDIQYRLYVLEKARLGFQSIEDGKAPHDSAGALASPAPPRRHRSAKAPVAPSTPPSTTSAWPPT
jgi:hypothetical protein